VTKAGASFPAIITQTVLDMNGLCMEFFAIAIASRVLSKRIKNNKRERESHV